MKLIFIGTSSGKTSLNRFHSSLLFADIDQKILIDCGDGISKALLSREIDPCTITHIILSHLHSDHFAGLPSLLTQMIINEREKQLNIYAHNKLLLTLTEFLKISYIFPNKLNFEINFIGYEFNKEIAIADSMNLVSRQNSHISNKYGINDEKLHFLSSSFLFILKGSKIFYTSDIGNDQDLNLFNDFYPELIISEGTHISLSSLEELENNQYVKKILITHIDNEKEIQDWHTKLPDKKKKRIVLAFDGMTLEL